MKPSQFILSFLWITAVMGVLITPRNDFYTLWSLYSIAFAAYIFILFSKGYISIKQGLIIGIGCRLLSFITSPQLTDDYFRYIWDGMVFYGGINPVEYVPSFLMNHPEILTADHNLYPLLNSKEYYSVYPPVAQLLFYLSYAINELSINGHIIFLKLILLLTDISIVYLICRILKQMNLPARTSLIYFLNPLIVIEYAGNLHFDGIMIAALLASILFAIKKDNVRSGISMSISICTKLTSGLLLPFMPQELYQGKKIIWMSLIVILISILFFWLVFGSNQGWLTSAALWFNSFEFNASLYYVAQKIYFLLKDYQNIDVVGPMMAGITVIGIMLVWLRYVIKKDLEWPVAMLAALTIYFLCSTTLHPWYLGTMLVISIFSGYLFPVVWTYLVFLSYSHYMNNSFEEKYLFILSEYLILFIWIIVEYSGKRLSVKAGH